MKAVMNPYVALVFGFLVGSFAMFAFGYVRGRAATPKTMKAERQPTAPPETQPSPMTQLGAVGCSLQRMVKRMGRRVTRADDKLATRLLCVLSTETLYKADCFDYLCWLGETEQSDRVKCAHFLVLASDGTTCWGKTYAEAVKVAMQHDKELYDAVQKLEMPEADESATRPKLSDGGD